MAVGRISGPLLKSNLLRNGIDLAFETDLLYLDVTNSRIGVNTSAPTHDVQVNGTTRTSFLIVDEELNVGNLRIFDNTILSDSGTIAFEAAAGEATVYHAKLQIDDFQIAGNTISTTVSNSNIEIRPDGVGIVDIFANTNITGNLDVTGNINATGNVVIGGNIQIGDTTTDTITVNARISSNLIPNTTSTYDLGSTNYKWNDIFVDRLNVTNELKIADFTFTGNTISTTANSIVFATAPGQSVVFNSKLLIDDFAIEGNTISTTVSNSNIEIRPNGSGVIQLVATTNITGNLNVTGNIDATGNVTIGGNIVIGDALTDNITINASIRSDLVPETDNVYDLGSPTFRWRNLYVTNFFTDAMSLPMLDIGNIMIRDNEITTTTGLDLYIDGNGSGGVRLGNFRIVDNVITNVVPNAVSQLVQSGTGYVKIAGTNGYVPPAGNNAQRPTPALYGPLPVGMTRYNTESKALEIWDGLTWASPAGASGAVSEIQANDIAVQIALTLG